MSDVKVLYQSGHTDEYGVIRLEEVPEGLILWVGGQIRYKFVPTDRRVVPDTEVRDAMVRVSNPSFVQREQSYNEERGLDPGQSMADVMKEGRRWG